MTGIDSLRNVLELERRKGYTDTAVIGGLDKYLHKQAEQIRQSINNPQLLSGFDELNLAKSNYGSYGVDERKRWMANVFGWLDKIEKATKTNSSQNQVRVKGVASPSHQKRKEGLDSPITIIKGISPAQIRNLPSSMSGQCGFALFLPQALCRLQPEETHLGTHRRGRANYHRHDLASEGGYSG